MSRETVEFTLLVHDDVSEPFDPVYKALVAIGPCVVRGDAKSTGPSLTLLMHRDIEQSDVDKFNALLSALSNLAATMSRSLVVCVGAKKDGTRTWLPKGVIADGFIDCERYGDA